MESRTFKCEGERYDHILHYQQVFGNAFERRESKCCVILVKNRWKGKQVIILQIAQQIKTKNINVVPQQLFCCQYKAKFLLEIDSLHWWSRQLSICYRHWQRILWMSNTKRKPPMNWHFTWQLKRIYENFKEAYKVQIDCLKDS